MHKNKLCLILLIFIMGCSKNNPIVFKDFQALRCELKNNKKKYDYYVFNINNGFLYFYDESKEKFISQSERLESVNFNEHTNEIFSIINKNHLIITNIEYYTDLNKDKKFIKKRDIINLKSLIIRSIIKNQIGDFVISRGKCIWIDPKLGIKY